MSAHGFATQTYDRPQDPRMDYEYPKSYVVTCQCGWKSKRRVMQFYAKQELADHIRLAGRVGESTGPKRSTR